MNYASFLYDNPSNMIGITAPKDIRTNRPDLSQASIYFKDAQCHGRITTHDDRHPDSVGRQAVLANHSGIAGNHEVPYQHTMANENYQGKYRCVERYSNESAVHKSRHPFYPIHTLSSSEKSTLNNAASVFTELKGSCQHKVAAYHNYDQTPDGNLKAHGIDAFRLAPIHGDRIRRSIEQSQGHRQGAGLSRGW